MTIGLVVHLVVYFARFFVYVYVTSNVSIIVVELRHHTNHESCDVSLV